MGKEVKKVESVSNVVVIADAREKLNLEVGNVYEFESKKLTITGKRSHTKEKPTIGKKTLWSGEIDGETFTEIDSTKLRKLFGLAERKREKSAGKTFEFEGNVYKLDETADKMVAAAFARYDELRTLLYAFESQYCGDLLPDNLSDDIYNRLPARAFNREGILTEYGENLYKIIAKVEAICLARKVAAEEEEKRREEEKQAKAKASKEHCAKVKEARNEFIALLASGCNYAEVTAKIADKYDLQVSDLA